MKDISRPAKSFLKVIDHQNQPADRSASKASETASCGWQSEVSRHDPMSRSYTESVRGYQQPSPGVNRPANRSFLKVIDHQNQPAGSGSVQESTSYSWQSPPGRRGDLPAESRVELSYRGPVSTSELQREQLLEDTRRVVDRGVGLAVAGDDGYCGRSDSIDRGGYRSASDAAEPGRYFGSTRERAGGFWDEMSAYCAEYEARVGRRDEVGEGGSQLARRILADYSDLDRRHVLESSMLDRRGSDRRYTGDDMDRQYRQGDDWHH